tara:strand:- start:120 stop:248 length:129 start_codon:yes stop_codon:yes gene_type:complete
MITIDVAALEAAATSIAGLLLLVIGVFAAGYYIGKKDGRYGL